MGDPDSSSISGHTNEDTPRRIAGDRPWLEYAFLAVILGLLWLSVVLILVAWRNGSPS